MRTEPQLIVRDDFFKFTLNNLYDGQEVCCNYC